MDDKYRVTSHIKTTKTDLDIFCLVPRSDSVPSVSKKSVRGKIEKWH